MFYMYLYGGKPVVLVLSLKIEYEKPVVRREKSKSAKNCFKLPSFDVQLG